MGVNGKEIVLSAAVPGLGAWMLALTDSRINPEMAATIGLGMGALGLMIVPFWLAMSRNGNK